MPGHYKGSIGCSMTIEHIKPKKKIKGNTCTKCKNFNNGYCIQINMRPSTILLATNCKYFDKKARRKKTNKE